MISKYNVDNSALGKLKRTFDGILFDSLLECRFYKEIIIPKIKSGEIKNVDRQVKYELLPSFVYKNRKIQAINYISDFDISYSNGNFEVVDVKGFVKPIDKIKSKLFKYRYPNLNLKFIGYTKELGWHEK